MQELTNNNVFSNDRNGSVADPHRTPKAAIRERQVSGKGKGTRVESIGITREAVGGRMADFADSSLEPGLHE
jgi:hypothetical protein